MAGICAVCIMYPLNIPIYPYFKTLDNIAMLDGHAPPLPIIPEERVDTIADDPSRAGKFHMYTWGTARTNKKLKEWHISDLVAELGTWKLGLRY